MKKSFLTALLAATLLLSILPGCNNTKTTEETSPIVSDNNDIAGVIMVNAGAPVEIMYDSTGSVLLIEGYGEKGLALASTLRGYVGIPCADAVYDVITKTIDGNFIPENASTVVLKFAKDSVIPDDAFTNNVLSKAQNAIPGLTVSQILDADLDSSGYISADKAKELLKLYVAPALPSEIEGKLKPTNSNYFLSASIDKALSYYTVNAITGDVSSCTKEDYENDYYSIYTDEEEPFHQEETYATEETYIEENPV